MRLPDGGATKWTLRAQTRKSIRAVEGGPKLALVPLVQVNSEDETRKY